MDYIFHIGIEDAQYIASKRIGRELTLEELRQVKKGVAFGLELSWEEVIETAIDEIVEN